MIGVGLGLLGISRGYSMVLVAVFVMGLGAGILDMVLSPIIAALQPGSRATALNWLHSFFGIGTVITVLVVRSPFDWDRMAHDFPDFYHRSAAGRSRIPQARSAPAHLGKEGGRTPLRDLCRNSSFLAVNVAIFLGGALELGLAHGCPLTLR